MGIVLASRQGGLAGQAAQNQDPGALIDDGVEGAPDQAPKTRAKTVSMCLV